MVSATAEKSIVWMHKNIKQLFQSLLHGRQLSMKSRMHFSMVSSANGLSQ